jgi:murein DD-endopeptidase MepM/ murein hydrolase activator NlpD
VTGSAFGHEVRLYADADGGTWRGLIGVDLDVAPGPHVVSLVGSRLGSLAARGEYQLTVEAKRFPTRRLRVDSRFVEPPASEEARIVREAERLAKVFTGLTPRRWDGPFRTPLPATPNSNFGTRSVFNGQARNPHAGVDFAGPTGTPVAAPNAGVVVLAENLYFTGNTVILDHGLGLYSLYAHLSRIDVALGGVATTGQTLGLLGATGRVTGPHLHWAVRLNEARVDPLSLVTATSATRVAPSGTRVEPADPSRPSIPAGRL